MLKTLTCEECGNDWQVPTSRGRYPSRCPDCMPAQVARANERQRELRTGRSPERAERATELLEAPARPELPVGLTRAGALRLFMEEVDDALALAAQMKTPSRADLKRAVVKLAHARGVSGTRYALAAVAGTCIALSWRLPSEASRAELRPLEVAAREVAGQDLDEPEAFDQFAELSEQSGPGLPGTDEFAR